MCVGRNSFFIFYIIEKQKRTHPNKKGVGVMRKYDAKLVGYYRSAQAFSVYATPASYITDVYAGDKLLR